ncbi:Pentatricopeptide repeat-containing-like protein [Gossypium australe]|uniref:Pentatricopeptide repeat-containing-like protein n=1 Tax=Gossypium australe TaxID=47621 RepID=A0A5B6WIB8_9ROSI|nr:Pentatricopeptide repeat-containing-like protein [Gossypium australe]
MSGRGPPSPMKDDFFRTKGFWKPRKRKFDFALGSEKLFLREGRLGAHCKRVHNSALLPEDVDKTYSRAANVPTFLKILMSITEMGEQWVATQIKQKEDSKGIHWKNLRDLILAHLDMKKKVDIFALSIYGLVVFPKALRHINDVVSDLFDQLDKRVTPVPTILAETFRSLSACRRAGEGRFIGCAQLLLAWVHSHFWKEEKVSYRVLSKNYSPLKEFVATPRRDDILEGK